MTREIHDGRTERSPTVQWSGETAGSGRLLKYGSNQQVARTVVAITGVVISTFRLEAGICEVFRFWLCFSDFEFWFLCSVSIG